MVSPSFSKKARRACILFSCLFLMSIIGKAGDQRQAVHAFSATQGVTSLVSHTVPAGAMARVTGYWTAARMKMALPVADTQSSGNPHHEHIRGDAVLPTVTAVAVDPALYKFYPYSTLGKVFFTDPADGKNYVCSATVVDSKGGNIVDTAGHCVTDGGSKGVFFTNWMFCPQYIDANCPQGKWVASSLQTSAAWVNKGDFARDFAFATLRLLDGKTVQSVVGAIPLIVNLSRDQTFISLGYPNAVAFDKGQRLYQCASEHRMDDSELTPPATGISCNTSQGASGGGWLIQINKQWYLDGNNSFASSIYPGDLFSPYYDNTVKQLFNQVAASPSGV